MIPVAKYFNHLGWNRAEARGGAADGSRKLSGEARALPCEFEPLPGLDQRLPAPARPLSKPEWFVLGACAGALGMATGMLILIIKIYLPLIHH